MLRTPLFALLLLTSTLPALADQADSSIFSQVQASIKLAQLSPDERRELRERWEQSNPEERIRLRRYIQDRVRQLPTPAQEAIRLPFPDVAPRESGRDRGTYRNQGDEAQSDNQDSRFGFGFERRHFEEGRPGSPGLARLPTCARRQPPLTGVVATGGDVRKTAPRLKPGPPQG